MSIFYKIVILLSIVACSKACSPESPVAAVEPVPVTPVVLAKVEAPAPTPVQPKAKPTKAKKRPDPENNISAEYINEAFSRVAAELNIPESLLRAVCYSESRFKQNAYAEGDGKGTNHAFGICQILRSTAESLGFKDPNCHRSFAAGNRTYGSCKLFGVYTNILYSGKYLKEKLDEYNGSWISAIAAYNAGSLRICKNGVVRRAKDHTVIWTCKRGGILNQTYVDGVLKALEEGR